MQLSSPHVCLPSLGEAEIELAIQRLPRILTTAFATGDLNTIAVSYGCKSLSKTQLHSELQKRALALQHSHEMAYLKSISDGIPCDPPSDDDLLSLLISDDWFVILLAHWSSK